MGEEILMSQVNKEEMQIGNNSIKIIDNNIIYIEAIGEQTTEIALAHKKADLHFYKLIGGKVNYLIDLNKAGKSSPEARKIWQELSESENTINVALVGIHPVAKVLASFVTGITRKNNIRFFNSKQNALLWLKG